MSSETDSCTSDATDKAAHLKLASVVKGVHAKLRRKFKNDGDFEEIWADHVKDKGLLSEYADAMHHLAVDHWSKHPETRIDWCRGICLDYFFHGGLKKVLEKDTRKTAFSGQDDESPTSTNHSEKSPVNMNTSNVESSSNIPNALAAESSQILDSNSIPSMNNNIEKYPQKRKRSSDSSQKRESKSENGQSTNSNNKDYSTLDDSFDELVDASILKQQNIEVLESQAESEKLTPEKLVGEKQGAESKCEEYLGRLQALQIDDGRLNDSDESSQDFSIDQDALYSKYAPTNYSTVTVPVQGKLRLLDVGSCYNPFLQFEEFVAIGIDISPAVESVFYCDFLHLEMQEPLQLAQDTHDSWLASLRSPITRLHKDCFHIIVFSLLLEYFPSPYQRWVCCQKAHELLMLNGLLLIITPDSHNVNRGAPQMKSWKAAIESLGFKRYKYIKQDHLHCMAFRKVALKTSILVNDISPDMLYIPQDVNGADDAFFCDDFPDPLRTEEENRFISENFTELPDFPFDF